MSRREEDMPRDGLEALFEDVLAEVTIDDDLLLAYADDPAALGDDERAEVEEALRVDPQIADQLRVLRAFDPARAVDVPGRTGGAEVIPLAERLRQRLNTPILAIAIPIAAVLALVLLQPWPDDVGSRGAPTQDGIEHADSNSPGTSDGPSEVQDDPSQPFPETELADASHAAPESGSSEAADSAPESGLVDAGAEPMLLAFVDPVYSQPPGASDRFFEAPTYRGIDAPPAAPRLVAPSHVARAASPQPELFWYASHTDEGGGYYLSAYEAESGGVLLDRVRLPTPAASGIQRISLADLEVALEPGLEVVWEIERWVQTDRRRGVQPATGWIELAPLAAAEKTDLEALPVAQRPAWLAAHGYWYDALSTLEALRAKGADPSKIDAARDRLIEAAGIRLSD